MNLNDIRVGQRIKVDSLLKYTAKDSKFVVPVDYLKLESTIKFNSGNQIWIFEEYKETHYIVFKMKNQLYILQYLFTLDSEEPEMVNCDNFELEFDTVITYKDHTGLFEDHTKDANLIRLYSRVIPDTQEFLMGWMTSPEVQKYYVGLPIVEQQLTLL